LIPPHTTPTLFPYTTLFRSGSLRASGHGRSGVLAARAAETFRALWQKCDREGRLREPRARGTGPWGIQARARDVPARGARIGCAEDLAPRAHGGVSAQQELRVRHGVECAGRYQPPREELLCDS